MSLLLYKQHSSIFQITGSDAERYLHGRCTQGIKDIKSSEVRWSFILSPQGKVEGSFFIFRIEQGFILVSEISEVKDKEEFLASLFRFKVADQVFAEDVTNGFTHFTLFNKDSNQEVPEVVLEDLSHTNYSFTLPRGSMLCRDVLVKKDELGSTPSIKNEGITEISDGEYEAYRIISAHPRHSLDITPNIFAPDLPCKIYVSYNKGCYAGQEVVEMASARGRANRTFVKIHGDFAPPVNASSELSIITRKDSGEIGKAGFVTSFIPQDISNEIVGTNTFTALGFVKTALLEESSSMYLDLNGTHEKIIITPVE